MGLDADLYVVPKLDLDTELAGLSPVVGQYLDLLEQSRVVRRRGRNQEPLNPRLEFIRLINLFDHVLPRQRSLEVFLALYPYAADAVGLDENIHASLGLPFPPVDFRKRVLEHDPVDLRAHALEIGLVLRLLQFDGNDMQDGAPLLEPGR